LYRALVRDKQIASDAEGFTGYPGNKYPQLFAFYAAPLPGHKPQEIGDAIHAEIDRLKKEDISDEELRMIKTRAKATLIRSLGSNEGLAFALGLNQSRYDDWRELFRSVDRIEKLTKADIRGVANQTFNPENRTVGIIEFAGGPPPGMPAAPQGGGQ
jgi:predicted Zn-dependent peptidase